MKKIITCVFLFCICATTSWSQADKAVQIYDEGCNLVHSGKFLEAVDLWKSIDNLTLPVDLKAKYESMVGVLYRDSIKDNEQAKLWFGKAVSLEPQIYNLKQDSIDIEVVYGRLGLASLADSAKNYPEAIEHYSRALDFLNHAQTIITRQDLDSTDLLIMYTTVLYGRAIDYGNNLDIQRAEVDYNELFDIYSRMRASSDSSLVMCSYSMGCMSIAGAMGMYQTKKKDIPAALNMAELLLNNIQQALNCPIQDVREAISYHLPLFLTFVADVYIDGGKNQEAVVMCNDALTWEAAEIHKPFIIDTRGKALLNLGEEEEARKCWEQVKELVPFYYDHDYPNAPLRDKFGKK